MPSRRSFLSGAGTLALAQFLAGCNASSTALKILFLQGSIPPQLLRKFLDTLNGKPLNFKPQLQLKNLLDFLQAWHKQAKRKENNQEWKIPFVSQSIPPQADLITLGDYSLASAIENRWLQPIEITQSSNWQYLPPRWQDLVRRNEKGQLDKNGKVWGAPYRWGTTLIVYRKDKFKPLGWEPTDWQDLWREELRDRISLLDQPREVIGLTLKKLGYSYNTENLKAIPALRSELEALHGQVKFYSSDYYLQPLVLGDTWLAVGWSNEVLPLLSRYSNLGAIIPRSGTALWTDLWVQPASATNSPLIQQWIDFCWQVPSAYQITLFTNGTSPRILTQSDRELPQDIQKNPLLNVDDSILKQSDFLLPLSSESQKQYEQLWQEIRKIRNSPER